MSAEDLRNWCAILVILLAGSETLPWVRQVKGNSWGQLIVAALQAIAATRTRRP